MVVPYFSVIIPTLNEEKYLPKVLNDLVKQKEKNFEIIIIDAFSQDQTAGVAADFKKLVPLRFYQVKKKNVAYQRNFGAKKARGKYLIFLDADGGMSATFISHLKKFIIKHGGLIFIPYIVPDESYPQSRLIFNLANRLIELSQNLNKPFSTGGSMIWEKNFFRLIGGFDEKLFLAEDHNLVQKAASWGVRAKFLPKIRVKFSLRRMKKEGQLALVYKYLLATVHVLLKGEVREKIFEYQMGGGDYQKLKTFSLDHRFKTYVNQIKNGFRALLEEQF